MLTYVLNTTVMSSAFSVLKHGVNTTGGFVVDLYTQTKYNYCLCCYLWAVFTGTFTVTDAVKFCQVVVNTETLTTDFSVWLVYTWFRSGACILVVAHLFFLVSALSSLSYPLTLSSNSFICIQVLHDTLCHGLCASQFLPAAHSPLCHWYL